MPDLSPEELRVAVLRRIHDVTTRDRTNTLEWPSLLRGVAEDHGIEQHSQQAEALLVILSDLLRGGFLALGGANLFSGANWVTVTEWGRSALAHADRSPYNPDGYLEYLVHIAPATNAVAKSYVIEALQAFNTGACFRSASVMIGAASESIVLEVRDVLLIRKDALGLPIHGHLRSRLISQILDQLTADLAGHQGQMPAQVAERFETFWTNFSNHIRTVRNDAGHPKPISLLTATNTHAALLMFPDVARLAYDIAAWIPAGYV